MCFIVMVLEIKDLGSSRGAFVGPGVSRVSFLVVSRKTNEKEAKELARVKERRRVARSKRETTCPYLATPAAFYIPRLFVASSSIAGTPTCFFAVSATSVSATYIVLPLPCEFFVASMT